MDWDEFYRNADYDRCIYLRGEAMVDYLERFLERFGPFERVASVGCGPGGVLFALASRYPDTEFHGIDISEQVVADNRERAAERGLENLTFAVDALPALETDEQFDLVYSAATLFFVPDTAEAVADLYDHVADGGYLVVNYPDPECPVRFDQWLEGRRREAFDLVLAGENVLSSADIRECCDTEPRDYWDAVDAAEDESFLVAKTPMVYLEKSGTAPEL